MKNPFKEILENEQLPEIIKSRVIKDINLINLSLDLADLFLVKSPDIAKTLFDDNDQEDEANNSKDKNPQID